MSRGLVSISFLVFFPNWPIFYGPKPNFKRVPFHREKKQTLPATDGTKGNNVARGARHNNSTLANSQPPQKKVRILRILCFHGVKKGSGVNLYRFEKKENEWKHGCGPTFGEI